MIEIRLMEMRDAARLLEIVNANRASFRQWFEWVDKTTEVAHEEFYIANIASQPTNRAFVIEVDGVIAGTIDLHKIDANHHSAEIGYWLDADFRGKGVMSTALTLLLDEARALGLHRVAILAATTNQASQNVARRGGFEQEGILREMALIDGHYQDMMIFSRILA